jgi:hypothetical protein
MALISSESGSWWFMIIFMAFCWFANSKKMWKYLHSFTQQFGVMMNAKTVTRDVCSSHVTSLDLCYLKLQSLPSPFTRQESP